MTVEVRLYAESTGEPWKGFKQGRNRDSGRSLWLPCGGGSPKKRLGKKPRGKGLPGVSSGDQVSGDPEAGDQAVPIPSSLPPVLQAGPGSISRFGPRTALAAANLQAMAFAMYPAVQAPTSWTAPRGGPWAAGGSSWHGPLWVVGLSCCMGTPSTVGLTATACTQLPVAPCTSSWVYCCATLTAMVLNVEGPCLAGPHPHPGHPVSAGWHSGQKHGLWKLSDLPQAKAWYDFCLGLHLKPSSCPSGA